MKASFFKEKQCLFISSHKKKRNFAAKRKIYGEIAGNFQQKRKRKKKRLQKRHEKAEKMIERKANAQKGKTLDEMMAYLDENGNISSTPSDPKKRRLLRHEDVQPSVTENGENRDENMRTGVVTFFNDAKGFGFIKDGQTKQSVFVHASQLSEVIKENDNVTFKTEKSAKGLSALNVKKIKA